MAAEQAIGGAAARARCLSCGVGLAFDAWSRGEDLCTLCEGLMDSGPAATFVRGPVTGRTTPAQAQDLDVPDELIAELLAALEAEGARRTAAASPLHEVLDELGVGKTAREWQWAAWGFAGGFALNVAVAKYAQMATSATMGEFVGPLLVGGIIAGAACAAIGWGLAKLKEG
ncbi:hypothetical protein AYO38_05010 [bacterium SCGC AG-212-C10]|nr:hypothetical protein AYO38_05010 [bacterium SCGC AG-212-C10]